MVSRVLMVLLCTFLIISLKAQQLKYTTSEKQSSIIENSFTAASILSIEKNVLKETLTSTKERNKYLNWTTPEGTTFEMIISEDNIIAQNFSVKVSTESGIITLDNPEYIQMTGYLKGIDESWVSILVRGDEFANYTIFNGKETHILTSGARMDKNLGKNDFIYYKAEDQEQPKNIGCGMDAHPEFSIKGGDVPPASNRQAGDCFPVKLGVAIDYSLEQEQGSVANAMDEIMTIMTNVALNYTINGNQNFADGIEYKIEEFFVSDCPTCDPWTSSLDPGDLLSSFNTWFANGGFSSDVKMGSLWSNRDFGGPEVNTIGLAYRGNGLICNRSAQQVMQHYTNNAEGLRVLAAHEIGHNWSGVHDPKGTTAIMAPMLVNTNIWSAGSKTDIGGQITSQGNSCLTGLCAGTCPDGCADFTADQNIDWLSGAVSFLDQSVNASSWFWEFGDGTTSTQQNPSHQYSNPGKYTVSLTVNGGDQLTRNNYIDILPAEGIPYTLADGGNMNAQDFGASNINLEGSLFEKGTASSFFPSNTGWITDLDGDVPNADLQSALYSPTFNMSRAGDYDIAFTLGMEAQFCNGPYAVQVQYSTNLGDSWTRLGSDADDNWYNRGPNSSCVIASGIFSDGMGFNFTNNAVNFTYDVSNLDGNESVIFRFLFSVDPNYNGGYDAGAYVDNFTITGPSSTALPIDLLSLEGYNKEEVNVVEWSTSNELNNEQFAIERSEDGREYEEIGTVKGSGTTDVVQDYSYVDEAPHLGLNYYRLIQRDFDGREETFGPVVIDFEGSDVYRIYPNVINKGQRLKLEVGLSKRTDVAIDLLSIQGLVVKSFQRQLNKGNNLEVIDIRTLAPGVYFARVNGKVISKIVVQ